MITKKVDILKPGIYPEMPFGEYLAIDAVSNSFLKRLDDCPAKALEPLKDTNAFAFGRAVHCAVLEGLPAFLEQYEILPKVNKRTNVGKAELAEFMAKHKGKQFITGDERHTIVCIYEAVYSHPLAKKLLAEGVTEQSIIWREPETQTLCKSRPDALPGEGKWTLIDLKTTANATEHAFARDIFKYKYYRWGAFYLDALYNAKVGRVGKNRAYKAAVLIAVEKEPPYMVGCYFLDPELIEVGRQEYLELLRQNKACKENDFYPHYKHEGLVTIEKPGWM